MGVEEGYKGKAVFLPRTPPPGMDTDNWRFWRDTLTRIDDKGSAAVEAHRQGSVQNILGKGSGAENTAAGSEHVYLDDVSVDTLGLQPGDDQLSFGAYIKNDDSTSEGALRLTFKDSGGSDISSHDSEKKALASYQRSVSEGVSVPSNADSVRFELVRVSGSGTITAKYAVLVIGPIAVRFSEAPLRMDREDLDQVDDGQTYARPRGTQLGEGVLLRAKSDNLINNPIFGEDEIGRGTDGTQDIDAWAADGWQIAANADDSGGEPMFVFNRDPSASLFGAWSLRIRIDSGGTEAVPASSTVTGSVDNIRIPVHSGDVLFWGGSFKADEFSSQPAGITCFAKISVVVFDDSGTALVSNDIAETSTTGWTTEQDAVEITNSDATYAILSIALSIQNSNGTATTLNTPTPDANFDGIVLKRQIRDPREQYPLGGWNRSDGLPDSEVLTATDAGSDATINIASHDRNSGFGAVTFPSGSITGLSYSTEYDVYADLPDYDVSTVNYQASTDLTVAIQDKDRVYIGRVETPGSGGANNTGGVEFCLTLDQWVAPDLQAGDVRMGDLLRCMTDDGRFEERHVMGAESPVEASVVEIETDEGHRVRCSERTPLITSQGWVFAKGAEGALIYDEAGHPARISKVTPLGTALVRRLSVGGASYVGGIDPHRLLFTHNATAKP